MDFDKTPSNEGESNHGSDEDDLTKKSSRHTYDDEFDFDFDDIDESDPRNIWRKRRKVSDYPPPSSFPSVTTNMTTGVVGATAGANRATVQFPTAVINPTINALETTSDVSHIDPYQSTTSLLTRPYDHQVPSVLPILQEDVMLMTGR